MSVKVLFVDDDEGNLLVSEAVCGDDFEVLSAGVGPVLSYTHKFRQTQLAVELQWLPELDVRNRLKGDFVWFKLALAF